MYYFIINPRSRSGCGFKVWKRIEKQLALQRVEYRAFLTERSGQAAEFADQLTRGCKEPKVIVVVGGDGTFNEVLDGLSLCNIITLGYIPAGSGEDLARGLKLPHSPMRGLKRILQQKYFKMVDYGVVTYGDEDVKHRRFIVSAGIGMDAAAYHGLLYSRYRFLFSRLPVRKLSYVLSGLKQYVKAVPTKGYILLDGSRRVEFNYIYCVSVQNQPCEGAGFRFAPKADSSDGVMEVCVLSHSSKSQVFWILLRALLGRTRNKGMKVYPCREVQIHVERPMAVHVDGESCFYQNELDVRCIERKIKMIV